MTHIREGNRSTMPVQEGPVQDGAIQEKPGQEKPGQEVPGQEGATPTKPVQVAIVGAGPYGLSLAAHLSAAGVEYRIFGHPMRLWSECMPRGMFLKSQGFASNLSDPAGTHTLAAFCRHHDLPYADYGRPVELDTFIEYGNWFQREQVPTLERNLVTTVQAAPAGYELTLDSGERVLARTVVMAVGVEHFARVPETLADLPADRWSHASALTEPADFAGNSVAVLGAGQSALESAALLAESGADVRLLVRGGPPVWNGKPLLPNRPLWKKMREPEAGLGSGWGTWFYSTQPALYRRLPVNQRVQRARTKLGPAGASWLRPRVVGRIPIRTAHTVDWAKSDGDQVRLGLSAGGVPTDDVTVDHVLAATGYRPQLSRLDMVAPELRSWVSTVDTSPAVDADFQSSVPGLYFIGPAVAPTFGPVMRFVYGAAFCAATVARRLAADPVAGP